MKALSIRHPWLDLLLCGRASVLIRARPTAHRGELLLHASGAYGPIEREAAADLGIQPPGPEDLGAIVGVAVVADCRLAGEADWELAAMPPRPGRLWAWRLDRVTPLARPVAVRGQRTLFEVEAALVAPPGRHGLGGTAA